MKAIIILWLALIGCVLAASWAYGVVQATPDYALNVATVCWLASAGWSALTRPWR